MPARVFQRRGEPVPDGQPSKHLSPVRPPQGRHRYEVRRPRRRLVALPQDVLDVCAEGRQIGERDRVNISDEPRNWMGCIGTKLRDRRQEGFTQPRIRVD